MAATSFGRYQLLDLLGRGGMGEVYRAHDTSTQRIVAIKLLPAHLASDPEFQRRFRREARVAASLNDPHVVPIHGSAKSMVGFTSTCAWWRAAIFTR